MEKKSRERNYIERLLTVGYRKLIAQRIKIKPMKSLFHQFRMWQVYSCSRDKIKEPNCEMLRHRKLNTNERDRENTIHLQTIGKTGPTFYIHNIQCV